MFNTINKRIMNRKEFNEKFIAELNNVDEARLFIAAKVYKNYFESAADAKAIKSVLIEKFNNEPSSWLVDEVAREYNKIKDFTPDNLQIWANYREFGNVDAPIAKPDGDFLAVSFKGIDVDIDGQRFSITNSEYVTIPANQYTNNGEYATISFATITKLLQIRGHLAEIARLVN